MFKSLQNLNVTMVILRDVVFHRCDILNVRLHYVYIVFYSEHVLY